MEIINLTQGSDQWHQHRAKHFNASDAPAMLGISPYKSRAQLLREKSTGITPEIDSATQQRMDMGHRIEKKARHLLEIELDTELFPCTGVLEGSKLSASFDGISLDGDIIWECKTVNAALVEAFEKNHPLPEHYCAQMEQQLLVSGASQALFTASILDDEGQAREQVRYMYCSNPDLRRRIIDGWKQFDEELIGYEAKPLPPPAPIGKSPEDLPILRINLHGAVTDSNLGEYHATALQIIGSINRDLQTDQDFANAEKTVKWCKQVEQKLDAAKTHALEQTASIAQLFSTIDHIAGSARQVRLELEKLIKTQKENIKLEYINQARETFVKHREHLQTQITDSPLGIDMEVPDFGMAIKGLRSLDSIESKLGAAQAQAKADLERHALDISTKAQWLYDKNRDYPFLLSDVQELAKKPLEDFQRAIESRIQEFQQKLQAEQNDVQDDDGYEDAAQGGKDLSITLEEMNKFIAPLSITEEGMQELGFKATDGMDYSKEIGFQLVLTYASNDFNEALNKMIAHLQSVQSKIAKTMQEGN